MDGNSAKKAPVLDHLVGTSEPQANTQPTSEIQPKPVLAAMNGNPSPTSSNTPEPNTNQVTEGQPKNRRTDKSQFEIELTNTVNRIMLKHFEHASEEIVQQVLGEVRARLPGQRKP